MTKLMLTYYENEIQNKILPKNLVIKKISKYHNIKYAPPIVTQKTLIDVCQNHKTNYNCYTDIRVNKICQK
jgi:hypothetical protein